MNPPRPAANGLLGRNFAQRPHGQRAMPGLPGAGFLVLMGWLLAASPTVYAGFVYETPTEFFTSGDFNGDNILDVLVVDKVTGNARVGYQDANHSLTWSAPLPTGLTSPAALAVGHFRDTNQDAIAVTSIELNRLNFLRLSDPSNVPPVAVLAPQGLGPNLLAGLSAPFGQVSNFDSLAVGSSANDTDFGATLLEDWALVADAQANYQEAVAQQAYLTSGNSLFLGTDPVSYLAAMAHGSNDSFVVLSPSNHFAQVLARPGLPSASQYVFGTFNGDSLPRFIFYVSGQSNLLLHSLVVSNSVLGFDDGLSVALSEPLQGVFYVQEGTDGVAVLVFGDGVQGLTLPGGSPVLSSIYRSGGGAAGNVFMGAVPLGAGTFALLDTPPGSASSSHAQVLHFDGFNFTQLTAGGIPAVSARATRANVWLFQAEPFVTDSPGFVSSVNAADWSSLLTLGAGLLSVTTESDAGPATGLSNPVTNNLGAPPAPAAFGIPDQYADSISLFTYAGARPPEAVSVTIAPPPGLYGGPIQVSFSSLNAQDRIYYRPSPAQNYQLYGGPFALTNDVTFQYYGSNTATFARSRLYAAAYSFGRAGISSPQPPLDVTPGSSNPAPVFHTNFVVLSDIGTVFYGRRSAANLGTIWAINLDGSGETYITEGARPRVSRDGRYLAFLREGDPFNNQGNLWFRDLATGQETRLLVNGGQLVAHDWDLSETNLIFDNDNTFWVIGLAGAAVQFPLGSAPGQGAPAVNPANGSIVFQVLYPGSAGLYLAPPDISSAQNLLVNATGPRWPAWSPDGQNIAFADGAVSSDVDGGKALWVLQLGLDYTNLYQITTADNGSFPHGAVWSPGGDALVGAATLFGTNGIWVIRLTDDLSDCYGPPLLLPASPGDPIDFVGSVVAARPPAGVVLPALFIRLEADAAVVYWSTAYQGFTLEAAPALTAPAAWTALPGPYTLNGYFYEYREPLASLADRRFFRLHYTGNP